MQDYGFRLYNPGLGRFLSVDPLTASYPWYTPYQFAGNKPIVAIDLDGLEEKWVTFYESNSLFGTWINRNNTTVKIDKNAILRDAETGHRVAVTHVTVITPDGNVKAEWDMVESVGKNGKMSNGFYPTARYNLSDKHKDYEAEEAIKENPSNSWARGRHLATSPEKQVEFGDFEKGVAAITALASPIKYYRDVLDKIAEIAAPNGNPVKGEMGLADDFLASATKPWGNQGLTVVGRALQKHSGREGSVFQGIKFSHKTANQEALNVLNQIIGSKNKVIQPAENGGKLIFDKRTGMGFGVSREGLFNGFRDLDNN